MVPLYIGLAVVVVLIFAGFGIYNWQQNRARIAANTFEHATPTPPPAPTSKPIQVHDLQPIGKPTGFPQPNLKSGVLSDTQMGGRGQLVDNIPCETSEQVVLHVHSHLAIIANGVNVQVPGFIGVASSPTGGCLYWIHTHAPDGILHVEAGDVSAPNGGPYTLGMFFDIWGEPLTRTQIGPFHGDVTAYVNGTAYTGDLRAIPLVAHQNIVLEIGKPLVPPPNYQLPPQE